MHEVPFHNVFSVDLENESKSPASLLNRQPGAEWLAAVCWSSLSAVSQQLRWDFLSDRDGRATWRDRGTHFPPSTYPSTYPFIGTLSEFYVLEACFKPVVNFC